MMFRDIFSKTWTMSTETWLMETSIQRILPQRAVGARGRAESPYRVPDGAGCR